MNITDIGESSNALLCITNRSDCCWSHTGGQWYYPNNASKVGVMGSNGDFYRNRGPSVVRLNRRNNVRSPTGIYHCVIPDQGYALYIGVYNIDQGK